jgi:hypothetical protein
MAARAAQISKRITACIRCFGVAFLMLVTMMSTNKLAQNRPYHKTISCSFDAAN